MRPAGAWLKDAPDALPEYGPDQDVGVQHEGPAFHPSYLAFRFFPRLARRISAYSAMS